MNILSKLLLVALIVAAGIAQAETAFTYQGRLGNAGQAADGLHDFRFRLFDDAAAGGQVGVDQSLSSVDVDAGIFTVQLDFGDGPFNAAPRWLEIAVRETGAGTYTTLTPRQRIGAAPFAIETLFVAPGAVDTAGLQDGAVTRPKIADDAIGTFQIENNTVTSSDIRDGTITHSDVANGGGLLHRKAELQRIQGTASTVAPDSSLLVTASCADENDIPIAYECEAVSTIHLLVMREATTENWDNSGAAASAICAFQNTHSSIAADARASIICMSVPGS